MIRKIFFILLLISNVCFSQLSNKHWIPPLHCRDASAVADQYLYLSTQETSPFTVTITDGAGVAIPGSPVTISATSPATINLGSGQNTKMFLGQNNVNVVLSNSGIILEGIKDFYVSFRVRSANHAETLISKGKPGIGTSFRLGHIINESVDYRKSFVASVMATENNTSVSLTGYDPGVTFVTPTGSVTLPNQNFILNAGQSIIFSGYSDNIANLDGAIGSLITSDKPIAVNSGNALGGIQNNRADFALDQIVSSSQIGNEYIFIEGNGLPSMELPLIVANEDNTEIYVNGSTTPVAIIDAGDYYLIDNSFYQGSARNQNLFVRTSKNVYAYQLIGGGDDTATAGLNFIPPLSCFFQNSVNIPNVDRIGNTIYTAELMILTYSSATVSVNGITIPTSQAQPVLGNTDWVTYRTSGINGNVNVQSTGPLAVGVFGFIGDASGFAGYYSGFGSNPEDTDVAICSNETIDLFEAITGNPGVNGTWTIPAGGAPLNNNIFDPAINIEGEYIYRFTKDCNASLVTIPVKVNVTINQAPNVGNNASYSTCINASTIDLFTLLGNNITPGGTWTPTLSSGSSIFDPAIDVSGVYTYRISASGACAEVSASVTVTNNPIPATPLITPLQVCDNDVDGNDTNVFVTFDLTQKNTEISNLVPGYNITYHSEQNEAIAGNNSITSIYSTNRIIYVRLTNINNGCFLTASFNLIVNSKPNVVAVVPLKQCDTDGDANTTFNLTQINTQISSDTDVTFSYHNSLTGAINNNDFVFSETSFNASNGSVVWARTTNTNGCFRITRVDLIVSTTYVPQSYRYVINDVCDVDISENDPSGDGIGYFDLTEIESALINQFPAGQSYTFSYYLNQNDAEIEQNAITSVTNFRNTDPNEQLIWVRIESNLYECAGLGPFLKLVVNPLPDINLGDDFIICVDPVTGVGSYTIDATPNTPGNYSYQWTPTNPNGNVATFTATTSGNYTVVVTNTDTSCSATNSIFGTISSGPVSVNAELLTPAFATGLASIQANVEGGFGIYEYSLNAIDWQSSSVFNGLSNGSYTIYVRDIQGCGLLASNMIQTITYPNYFTPNGDGFNDTWNIILPLEYEGLISIFDRYGKLLKQIKPNENGWDGTFNGEQLPSSDYWFKVEYTEENINKEFKSHFTLKR
ncbi:T9SS type B sorting domain-containing protein [Flavobacterium sp. HXWNR69]|uniref:T9SS type B sorting domain-containing protein n=1 Tax=Flavobacterium fragile TaxID=2949085 RepID=A0ABT0TI27_9FLAO|nr:T9SS type B sorting domain-containing protein [Flavobacterium sp. HXWNR69]MCL9770631.1 T9SS type B sorting domain-containing protein [Flavobacterium sp. HXWNR69]